MAQKTKDGMWCRHCQKVVTGTKSTHHVWNTVAFLATWLPFLGARIEPYRCPTCGHATVAIEWHQLAGWLRHR